VRGDPVGLGGGHAEVCGDLGERGSGNPAQLVLDGMEGGQEPGTLLGEGLKDAPPVGHVRPSMRDGHGVHEPRRGEALLA